jgi:hypothetical protein
MARSHDFHRDEPLDECYYTHAHMSRLANKRGKPETGFPLVFDIQRTALPSAAVIINIELAL